MSRIPMPEWEPTVFAKIKCFITGHVPALRVWDGGRDLSLACYRCGKQL